MFHLENFGFPLLLNLSRNMEKVMNLIKGHQECHEMLNIHTFECPLPLRRILCGVNIILDLREIKDWSAVLCIQ